MNPAATGLGPTNAPAGKRETQRIATRDALRASALEHFRRVGFDAASVADIAADAGVTERTFYRHFPSKEAVLFQDYEQQLDWFATALDSRPGDEHILDSVRESVLSFPDDREILYDVAALRDSVLSADAIRDHVRKVQGVFARTIEHSIRRRQGDRPETELPTAVMSEAIAGAVFAAMEVWMRRSERGEFTELEDAVTEAIGMLRAGLG